MRTRGNLRGSVEPSPDAADEPWPRIPLERLGLDRPFTAEDRAQIDAGLGLEPVRR